MSNHSRVLFDQPIDYFNGINFIEIVSEDRSDDDLIVSKITLENVDHKLDICLIHFLTAGRIQNNGEFDSQCFLKCHIFLCREGLRLRDLPQNHCPGLPGGG